MSHLEERLEHDLNEIRDQIANMDINNLTPVEALNILNEIKKLSGL